MRGVKAARADIGALARLVEEAATAGRISADDPEAATFMLLSLNAAHAPRLIQGW